MPFPVDENYINETESVLKVKFPKKFKKRMMKINGGEFILGNYEIELYPFFDKTDKKRISRTCNHIALETRNAKEWALFSENYVAIGSDGFGNQLVLTHDGYGVLFETLYLWNHETGKIKELCKSINNNILTTNSFWQKIKFSITKE